MAHTQHDSLRIIRCGIGTESYCLEMSSVDGVGEAALVQRFFQPTPEGQVGTMISQDEAIPVFSLATRLGRTGKALGREHLVILKTSLGRWALLVESVSRVLQINLKQLHRVPEVVNDPTRKLFKGVVVFPADNAPTETPDSFAGVASRRQRDAAEIVLLLSPERLHPEARSLDEFTESESAPHAADGAVKDLKVPTVTTNSIKRRGQVMLLSVTDETLDDRPCSFGLSLSQILEVVSSLNFINVPTAPDFVQGLACWRDQPVPVLDLARRLGLPSRIHDQRLVIARGSADGDLVAFPVEAAIRSQRLPIASRPCPVPHGIDENLVRGAYELDSETLMIPDLRQVLTSV